MLDLLIVMTATEHPFHESTFFRHWTIATTLGLGLGTLLGWYVPRLALAGANGLEQALAFVIPNQGLGQVILTLPSYLVTTTSVGTIIGLCLSLGQGVVLRKWEVPWARAWLVAGGMGAGLSYILMAALNVLAILFDPDPRLLKGLADSGLWIGVIMGITQWRVLRTYAAHTGWWIAVSAGVWGTGSILNRWIGHHAANAISSLLTQILRRGFGREIAAFFRFFAPGQVILWIIAGVIGGVITAKVLAWLMENQLKS